MQPRPVRRARNLFGCLASLFLLLAIPGGARAHETWADGKGIPDWVKKACCGPADAHHLSPAQVRHVGDAFWIDGYPYRVPDVEVLPSEDGEYWAFYTEFLDVNGAKTFSSVFCFFAPHWS